MNTKPKACFDLDGCLANGLIIKPLIEAEHAAGFIADKAIQQVQTIYDDSVAGKIPYEQAAHALLELHSDALKNAREIDLYNHAVGFFTENKEKYFRYFGERVFSLLRKSCELVIVTAEPEYASHAIQTVFSADSHIGTEYEVTNGVFTGNLALSLAHRNGKKEKLASHDVKFAFGDSVGDVGMLETASYPICISPSPELAQIATERGWFVNSGNEPEYLDLERFIKDRL